MTKEDIRNNNIEALDYSPNFVKIDMGFLKNLFWDYFMYIDMRQYNLDKMLESAGINAKFSNNEYMTKDGSIVFCRVRIPKRYLKNMVDNIFPELHKKNIIMGGKKYLDTCEKLRKNLIEMVNND